MADLSTYGDVVTAFYDLIGDDETNQRLVTTAQVDTWANACLYELGEYAAYLDEVDARTANPSTGTITFGSLTNQMFYGMWRAECDDEAMQPTSTKRLYAGSRTWDTDTGEPRYYYLDSLRDFDSDDYTIGVYPKSTTSWSFRFFFKVSGDALSYANRTDNIMLPLWATQGILWGVLAHYYEHEGRKENRQTSAFYRMLFDDLKVRLRGRSHDKTRTQKAWGESRTFRPAHDWRAMIPWDGIQEP